MNACAGFSQCRIEFLPNDRQDRVKKYSDRSSLELRYHDLANYSLRALDIENQNREIFNIPLENEDQYRYGESNDEPDEIQTDDGTYRLWLNKDSSQTFYKELRKAFEEIEIMRPPKETSSNSQLRKSNSTPAININTNTKPRQPDPAVLSPKDLLLNIHQLSEHIKDGDAKSAAQLASQLTSKGARFQAKSSENTQNEQEFTIQVQLDGNEYSPNQHGARIPIDVFPSTTVRELRALFELTHYYPPSNQYFFVNGRLAYDDLTMKQLKVGPNSLFVLFVLTHQKTYTKRGPWKCNTCDSQNQEVNNRCKACTAARQD